MKNKADARIKQGTIFATEIFIRKLLEIKVALS
jgi:hypothetical protein